VPWLVRKKYSRLVHWSARRITRSRDKAIFIPLSLDLRAMGMTPGVIPVIAAEALPPLGRPWAHPSSSPAVGKKSWTRRSRGSVAM
jgi:hypothetical protein